MLEQRLGRLGHQVFRSSRHSHSWVTEAARWTGLMALAVTRQEVVHPGRPGESSGCQVITHPDQEAWMNIHKNARLTPYRRQELVARVERGEPVTAVARAFGVSRQTARKWMLRKRDAGMVDSTAWAGDGSSRPAHSPRQTAPKIQLAIKVPRWQRW